MAKFKIVKGREGYDAVQVTRNGPWWHSEQRGYWPSHEACKKWIEDTWGPDVEYVDKIYPWER